MHSHHYLGDDPALFAGKRVVVLGHGQLGDGHRGRGRPDRRARLPRRPPRRVDRPQVRLRPPARPVRDHAARSRSRSASASCRRRCAPRSATMERYGLPKPDHRPLEAHPTISRHDPHAAHARRHHAQAEHRAADRATASSSPTAARSAPTSSIYGTGYKVSFPFFDPALVVRARQRPAALQARLPPRAARPVLHRAAAAARGDDAARRGAVGVDLRPPDRPLRAAAARRAAWPTSRASARRCASATSPPSATRCRSTTTTTCTSSSSERKRGAKRRVSRREATKEANRAAIARRRPRGLRRARLRGRGRARRRPPHGPRLRARSTTTSTARTRSSAPSSRRSAPTPAARCARRGWRAGGLRGRGLPRVLRLHRRRARDVRVPGAQRRSGAAAGARTSCARTSPSGVRAGRRRRVLRARDGRRRTGDRAALLLARKPRDRCRGNRLCSRFVPRRSLR